MFTLLLKSLNAIIRPDFVSIFISYYWFQKIGENRRWNGSKDAESRTFTKAILLGTDMAGFCAPQVSLPSMPPKGKQVTSFRISHFNTNRMVIIWHPSSPWQAFLYISIFLFLLQTPEFITTVVLIMRYLM